MKHGGGSTPLLTAVEGGSRLLHTPRVGGAARSLPPSGEWMAREANMRKFTITFAETSDGGFDCSARVSSTIPGDIIRRALDIDPVVYHSHRYERPYPLRVEDLLIDMAGALSTRLWTAMANAPITEWDDVLGTRVPDGKSTGHPILPSKREQRD